MRLLSRFSCFCCVALVGASTTVAQAATPPTLPAADTGARTSTDTMVTVVDVTPEQGKTLRPLLRSEIAKAVADGRTPFVEVGATWCGPCQQIKSSLGDRRMIDAFGGTYIIRLDADQWNREERLRLGLASGYLPTFFAVDSTGKATGKRLLPKTEVDPETLAPQLKHFFQANRWKKS